MSGKRGSHRLEALGRWERLWRRITLGPCHHYWFPKVDPPRAAGEGDT